MKKQKDLLNAFSRFLYRKGKKWFQSAKVREDLNYINRKDPTSKAEEDYYTGKIKVVLILLFAALFLGIVLSVQSRTEGLLRKDNGISRNKPGKAGDQLILEYRDEQGIAGETSIQVEARHYTDEELEKLFKQLEEELPGYLLGNNEEPENVQEDLRLPEKFGEYPFLINWESSNYNLLQNDGTISEEELEELVKKEKTGSVPVSVTAVFTYDDFYREKLYYFRICPRILSEEETMRKAVEDSLIRSEKESRTKDYYYLPGEVNGKPVSYKEKKDNPALPVFLILLMAAGGVYFLADKDLAGKAAKRQEKLQLEYSDFASRLALYLTCGLTVRGAFFRIASDYADTPEEPIAEEILQACREMESGVTETVVYDHFGKRCRGSSYRRLSGLLLQNLKKGSSSLAGVLRMETREAFEERKRSAKERGEEAGTKMLAPLMLLLMIVMAMILIPAFLSFS